MTYRLVFEKSSNPLRLYDMLRQALQDYNIEILQFGYLETIQQRNRLVWDLIDKPVELQRGPRADLIELDTSAQTDLAFAVRYQLEVCISNGYLNEHNISQAFISRLKGIDTSQAQDLLEYVANHAKRIFDPMSIFSLKIIEGTTLRSSIPPYCVYIRSATVTPTTVYFQTPVPETSNRVIREFARYADRFLRVRFTEEKTQVGPSYTRKKAANTYRSRVRYMQPTKTP